MDVLSTNQELTQIAFLQRENEKKHFPYERELVFYEYVKAGDIEMIKKTISPLGGEGTGHLSDEPKRNILYHLIVSIAMITRFCIEGGMEPETAYNLSDLYIQKSDVCTSCEELYGVHEKMVFDFVKRMNRLQKEQVYSKPIVLCMDYIYNHLHQRILIPELAAHVKLTPPYLSKLFHQQVGLPLANYIRSKRIETAKNMLKFSDSSSLEICNYLVFSSHSHFISVFKNYVGMTPKDYRNKYFRSNWKR